MLPFFLLNGSLSELFKIPALYSHYKEHRSADNSIDLFDFLAMHYIGDDQNNNDQDRDMQLPFKKVDVDNSFQIVFEPVTKPILEKKQEFPSKRLALAYVPDFNLTHPTLESLFRPPIA